MRKKTHVVLFALMGLLLFGCGKKVDPTTKPTPKPTDTKPTTQQVKKYTVSVVNSIQNAGTITGAGQIDEGKSTTLKATAADGYTFLGFYDGDTELTTNAEYTFTVTKDVTITAKWTAKSYNLVVKSFSNVDPDNVVEFTDDSLGTVEYTNEHDGVYTTGETITLTATPATGYQFNGWYLEDLVEGDHLISMDPEHDFAMVPQNATIKAIFGTKKCTIEIVANMPEAADELTIDLEDGTEKIDEAAIADYGMEVNIFTYANNGYSFLGFYEYREDGDYSTSTLLPTDYYFNAEDSIKFLAFFEANDYDLFIIRNDENAGNITVEYGDNTSTNCNCNMAYNTTVTLTATANDGYTFVGWYTGDDYAAEHLITNETTTTFKMIYTGENWSDWTQEEWIFAKFVGNDVQVNFSVDSVDGEGNPLGTINVESGKYEYNSVIRITATPNEGYKFDGWYIKTWNTETEEYDYELYTDGWDDEFYVETLEEVSIAAKFSVDSYNVYLGTNIEDDELYDAILAANPGIDSNSFEYGSTITVTAPTVAGYTFLGWYYDGDCVYNGETITNIDSITAWSETAECTFPMWAGDLDCLIAAYSRLQIKLTYNTNGGDDTSVEFIRVSYGLKTKLEVPTRYGYSFQYWDYADNNGVRHILTDANGNMLEPFTMLTDMTIRAKWLDGIVIASFDTDGGTVIDDVEVTFNHTITRPADPEKTGYTFVNWFDADGVLWSFSQAIVQNTTLYAHWTINQYSITLESADDSIVTVNSDKIDGTYDYNTSFVLEATVATGYSFKGWYIGETLISDQAVYTYTLPDKNVTITADYIPNKYTGTIKAYWINNIPTYNWLDISGVKIYVNGTLMTTTTIQLDYNSEFTVTIVYDENKPYQTFNGYWSNVDASGFHYIQYNGSRVYATTYTFTTPAKNFTINCEIQTIAKSLVVTKSSNTGSEGTSPYFKIYGNNSSYNSNGVNVDRPVTLYASEIEGYTFAGWYVKGTNTQITEELEYEFDMPNSQLQYEARYTNNDYNVNVYEVINDNIDTTDDTELVDTITKAYHDEFTYTAEEIEGYTFTGWYYSGQNDPFETNYAVTFEMPYNDVSIEARYEINSYNLVVNYVNGNTTGCGFVPGEINYNYGATYTYDYNTEITLTVDETTNGYNWVGWFISGTKVSAELTYTFDMPDANVTVEAKWAPQYWTITLDANGGTLSSSSTVSGQFGEYYDLPIPTKADGTFTSWKYEYTYRDDQGVPHTVDILLTDEFEETATSVTSEEMYSFTQRDNAGYLGITAKAVWGIKSLKVTFDTGYDSTYDSGDTQTYVTKVFYNNAVARPEDPIRKGHTFLGWYTTNDEFGVEYDFTTLLTDARTIYAKWQVNTYTIYIGLGTSNNLQAQLQYYVSDSINGTTSASIHTTDTCIVLEYGTVISFELDCYIGRRFSSWTYFDITNNSGYHTVSSSYMITETAGSVYTFAFKMAVDIRLACNLTYVSEMSNFAFTSTFTECIITGLSTNGQNATGITVPKYVTQINDGAFAGNTSLQSLTIPFIGISKDADETQRGFANIFSKTSKSGLTAVTPKCFIDGTETALATRYIPASLRTVTITDENIIPECAFYNTTMITTINFNDEIQSIEKWAFYGCTNITTLTLPKGLKVLRTESLRWMQNLQTLVIPNDNMETIEYGALHNVPNIKNITLPFVGKSYDSVGAENVLGWIFGDTLDMYSYSAVQQYYTNNATTNQVTSHIPTKLSSVTVNYKQTEANVGVGAFMNCNSLVSVSINKVNKSMYYTHGQTTDYTSSQSVMNYAFYGCTKLANLDGAYFSDCKTVRGYAFYKCTSLTEFTSKSYDIYGYAFYQCKALTTVTTVGALGTWFYYETDAFYGCTALESVNITGVTSISGGLCIYTEAFYGCTSLTSLNEELFRYVEVGPNAFYGCSQLEEFTPKAYLGGIGNYAFYGCSSLSSMDIKFDLYGTKKPTIGSKVFMGCTNLETVTISNDTTEIGDQTFAGCSSLISITVPFVGKDKNATIANNAYTYSFDYTFAYWFGDNSVNGCTKMSSLSGIDDDSTFANLPSITLKYIPNSLTDITITNSTVIPAFAVAGIRRTSYTMNITISNESGNNITIGRGAFMYSHVANIDLANVTVIRELAFYDNYITGITLPDGLLSIGNYAFASNVYDENTEIVIPDSVTTLGSFLFFDSYSDYNNVCSITLGHDIQSIAVNAFKGVNDAVELYYNGTLNEFGTARATWPEGWNYVSSTIQIFSCTCNNGTATWQ